MDHYTPKPECLCASCGKFFAVYPYQIKYGTVRYCSKKCKGLASRKPSDLKSTNLQTYTCLHCGILFERHPSLPVGKYCSRTCFNNARRDENRSTWNGKRRGFRGQNWGQQRKLAFDRDQGICQRCGKLSKKIHKNPVHHIKPYRLFDGDYESANQLSNLITLCPKCHKIVEAMTLVNIKRSG